MTRLPFLFRLAPCLALLTLAATPVRADSFDQAVTQYLKGFEYCKEAKSHLSAGRPDAAQKALQQYDTLLKQASQTDNRILSTSQRGMDGNLKFCQRVARDVEVEVGTPLLNQALAACDGAQKALGDGDPAKARAQLEQFRKLKASALARSPSLNSIFTVKNQLSRCERIESKIASSSKKQEAIVLALDAVQEESAAYLASCQQTLTDLNREKVDDPVLRDANQGAQSAESHRRNVQAETLAQQAFRENPAHPVKPKVDAQLRQGEQCMGQLKQAIGKKSQELAAIKSQFARYNDQLRSASQQCAKAGSNASAGTTRATYEGASTSYESALQARNKVRETLTRDSRYQTYEGWESVREIESQMQNLNGCLDRTRKQIDALFASLPAAAAAVASIPATTAPVAVAGASVAPPPPPPAAAAPAVSTAPAPVVAAPQAASTGPGLFKGTVRINALPPEFLLFYVPDGTQPKPAEITIDRTGFDSLLYVAKSGGSLTFKNKDNTSHRITASNDALGLSENLARLQPRQTKPARVSWPEHSIATVRSDRGALPASYVANVPSANYLQLTLSGNEVRFTFKNDKAASTAYLILPDADPLTFTLSPGETKSLAITRKGVPVGSLLVTGE